MDRYAFQQSLTETVAGSEGFMKAMEQCSSLSTEDKTSANARLSLFRCCDCRTQTLEIVERKTSNDELYLRRSWEVSASGVGLESES